MAKRVLSMTPSELTNLTKKDFLAAVAESEGRVMACETIGLVPPMLVDVTNAEFVASQGADLILLNMFDVQAPVVQGLPAVPAGETVRELKRLTGRMIGVNLEPVDDALAKDNADTVWAMSPGRYATVENAVRAQEMGVDMLVLTGNPGNGVSNAAIVSTLTAIGTSQGGADVDTIRRIALACKMTGTDIHHIGDTGYMGMALPENIMAYSVVIRGIRHTYHRIAQSIAR